jgi:hypothetical protein
VSNGKPYYEIKKKKKYLKENEKKELLLQDRASSTPN